MNMSQQKYHNNCRPDSWGIMQIAETARQLREKHQTRFALRTHSSSHSFVMTTPVERIRIKERNLLSYYIYVTKNKDSPPLMRLFRMSRVYIRIYTRDRPNRSQGWRKGNRKSLRNVTSATNVVSESFWILFSN